MASIGLDLRQHVASGLLRFQATRPTVHGLESHLATVHQALDDFQPVNVVLDPVTSLVQAGTQSETHAMLLRMIDYLKSRGITTWMTTLTEGGPLSEQTELGISSLIDTWILLRDTESNSERNRGLYVIKSRGMANSNQVREYRLTDHGVEVLDVYLGPGGSQSGSARLAQEAKERAEETVRAQEFQRQQAQMEAERKALEAQMAALQARLTVAEQELKLAAAQEEMRRAQMETAKAAMAKSRQADALRDHAGLSQ